MAPFPVPDAVAVVVQSRRGRIVNAYSAARVEISYKISFSSSSSVVLLHRWLLPEGRGAVQGILLLTNHVVGNLFTWQAARAGQWVTALATHVHTYTRTHVRLLLQRGRKKGTASSHFHHRMQSQN
jgi:hypothetical protein